MNDPLRAIWGALVGDACGATLEFCNDVITPERAKMAMTMPGGGSLRVGPGQITDDGELTLALWSVLRTRDSTHGFPLEDVAKAYAAWYESSPFDIGQTCSFAFDALNEWVENGTELACALRVIDNMSRRSEANGAMMRASPIAVWWASQPLRRDGVVCIEDTAQCAAKAAQSDARLSHPGRVTQNANAVYVYALTLLLLGCSSAETIGHVDAFEMCDTVHRWVEESKGEWDSLSDADNMIGHVRHGFVAALWFLRRPTIDYEEAMSMILQRGGDTDTNAAIVGGLVACYQPIPEAMKEAVAAFDCTVKCLRGQERPREYGVKYQMGS